MRFIFATQEQILKTKFIEWQLKNNIVIESVGYVKWRQSLCCTWIVRILNHYRKSRGGETTILG